MRKRLYLFILLCWLAAVFTLLLVPLPPPPPAIRRITFYDKAAHLVFFGVLTYLLLAVGLRWNKLKFYLLALISFSVAVAFNISAEYLQGFVPGREPSWLDFSAGVAGAAAAIPIAYAIHFSPRRRIALHVCCAPCATAVQEILAGNHRVELFFYNPNIHPKKEYLKRLKEVRRLAKRFNLKLKAAQYEHKRWLEAIKGFETEPEGGARCDFCFRERLRRTADWAMGEGIDLFATTLSISPHKDSSSINRIGERIGKWAGLDFFNRDFKKNDGYRRSLEMAKELGLYRQNYCGCEFSKKKPETLS